MTTTVQNYLDKGLRGLWYPVLASWEVQSAPVGITRLGEQIVVWRNKDGQVQALENGDTEGFLALVNDSGRSSWEYLQNIAPEGAAGHQELAVTLALCRRLLRGRGAVRVHGGGFAGTALCMVPEADYPAFRAELEALLAPDCCHWLQIV